MVGSMVAAAPPAVTLGEHSIWILFYVCSPPSLDGPSADLFNVLTSCHKVVALSSQLIFLVSNLVLGGDSFIIMEKSPPEPTRCRSWTSTLLQNTELFVLARAKSELCHHLCTVTVCV